MRITGRGVALLSTSLIFLAAGFWFGLVELVMLGVTGLALISAAFAQSRRCRFNSLWTRQSHVAISTHLICGQTGRVTARMTPAKHVTGGQFTDLTCFELAPSGSQIVASPGALEFRYTVTPRATGHWNLGPFQWQRSDLFGLWVVTKRLGESATMTAWPRTTNLPVTFTANRSRQHIASGASPDDVTLREYVPGDDLRRVHWPTTARKGAPMIRENGGQAKNSVRVMIDPMLLHNQNTREWALEHGASVACSALDASHRVQLVVGDAAEYIACPVTGRQQVLTQVAQFAAANRAARHSPSASRTFGASQTVGARGVNTYAIVGPNFNCNIAPNPGNNYAVVLGEVTGASAVSQSLRNAGWRVVGLPKPIDHLATWRAVGA